MNVYTGFPTRNVNCLDESETMRGHSAIEPADGTQDTGNMSGLSCGLVVCWPSQRKHFRDHTSYLSFMMWATTAIVHKAVSWQRLRYTNKFQ